MQHRRRTGPGALRTALAALLACCALGVTAVAAAGGAQSDPGAAVLQIARQQLGDPYVWGGTGPDSWDCSGLTSRLWREVGGVTSIPRIASDQQAWAVPIPVDQLLIGDLVFFGDPVTHVALYAGNGTIVDASSSQHRVVERKIWSSGVVRYGRVPRPGMPAVKPWTPPAAPSPSPTASASASPSPQPAPAGKPTPSTKPSATPSAAPARPTEAPIGALSTTPLKGLPSADLPPLTPVADRAVANARSVRGSKAWTDVELVRTAWRHAGGGVLPGTRAALVATGTTVSLDAARIGDVVAYGDPASHLGMYLGHGYMVDASPRLGSVVVRRVYSSAAVRFVRLSGVK